LEKLKKEKPFQDPLGPPKKKNPTQRGRGKIKTPEKNTQETISPRTTSQNPPLKEVENLNKFKWGRIR